MGPLLCGHCPRGRLPHSPASPLKGSPFSLPLSMWAPRACAQEETCQSVEGGQGLFVTKSHRAPWAAAG